MAEASYEMTEGAFNAGGNARYARDDTLLVKFYHHPRENKLKSAEEGRPIFDDAEYVSIMVPGNKDHVIERPATERDKQRFPRHYAAFKQGHDQETLSGTPLEKWPGITRAQVEELKHFNVKTVEQLSEIADSHAQKFMGINALRESARRYLEASADNAVITRMESELEERDNTIASQQQALNELMSRVKELEDGQAEDSGGNRQRSRSRSRAAKAE